MKQQQISGGIDTKIKKLLRGTLAVGLSFLLATQALAAFLMARPC